MLNNENKDVMKGQGILAQGKRSVALGWETGLKSSARKGLFKRFSYFRRNRSSLFLRHLMLFNSVRRNVFALYNIFTRTFFVVSPITQGVVSVRSSRNYALGYYKYANTYAKTDIAEYWAEGVQDWFNVNAEAPKPDGKHNPLNTREELKKYDPDLYELISHYFSEFKVSPSKHLKVNRYKI